MIKIENVSTVGWEPAIRGARNPMNSWDKSDSLVSNDPCNTLDDLFGETVFEGIEPAGTQQVTTAFKKQQMLEVVTALQPTKVEHCGSDGREILQLVVERKFWRVVIHHFISEVNSPIVDIGLIGCQQSQPYQPRGSSRHGNVLAKRGTVARRVPLCLRGHQGAKCKHHYDKPFLHIESFPSFNTGTTGQVLSLNANSMSAWAPKPCRRCT